MAKSAEPGEGLRDEPFSAAFFFDNPTFGRALRYTFADKRLGRAVFMNALLLVVALGVVQDLFTRGGFGLISEKLSFGRAAFLTVCLVETVAVSILGPLSFAHIFNAERREDCFDQVVATGCSPLRVLLGRLGAVLVFLAVTVGSSLPFFIFASFVLKGASAGEVAEFFLVLGLYGTCIGTMTMATCVAVEDAAFPVVLSGIFTIVAIAAGFSPHAPPAGAAWSPVRHVIVELAPVTRQLGVGDILAPSLYGFILPTALISCAGYVVLTGLALAYTCVGPDLELSEGLDSFSSVTLKRGAEANRGRRGLAATLLRTVQLRFLYENLGPRLRALGPFLRLGSTATLFAVGHVMTLGTLWPRTAVHALGDLKEHTTNYYIAFTAISVGLIALASSGSRAAVLARVPVLSIGPWKVGRFPALFFLLAVGLALPPLLFVGACRAHGIPLDGEEWPRIVGLYGLITLYAIFMFSVGLVTAMLTTNPYSAMGTALGIIFFANLLPLGWIPLFTSNVVTEDSAPIVDVSPVFAAWAVVEPDDGLTLTTIRDEETKVYEHKPSWKPFVYVHAPIAFVLLVLGLLLERRDARTRKFLSALALAAVLLVPAATANAQTGPGWRLELELGLGGKTPQEGFAPITATIENPSDATTQVTVVIRETTSGAAVATLGPVTVARGEAKRVRGVAPAEALTQSQTTLVAQALADEKTVLAETTVKPATLGADRLLVVLDKTGSLPFAPPQGGLKTVESAPARRGRAQTTTTNQWTTAFVARAEDLPATPQAWTGAGAVFLNDLDLAAWEPAAAKALAGWVGRGGDLVIALGPRAKLLLSAPCALGEALRGELEALPDLAARTNVDVLMGEPAPFVAALEPRERDRVLERDALGKPLAIRRSVGSGRLTLLAFDPWQPPFLHDDATRALFERILSYGPRYHSRSEALFPELSALRVQPARIGPMFGALLLYALLVGPGIYFALRPRKKGLLAWVLIPAVTIVFSLLTPLYRLVLARSESALVMASVVETSSGDPWEHETIDALIFSGGLERHTVAVRGDDVTAALLIPPRGFRGGPPRIAASLGDPFQGTAFTAPIDVPLWGARYVSTESVRRGATPRFEHVRVAVTSHGLEYAIENKGPLALEDAVLVFPQFQAGAPHAQFTELPPRFGPGEQATGTAIPKPAAAYSQGGPTQKDLAQTIERRLVPERVLRHVEDAREPFEAVLVAHEEQPSSLTAAPQVRTRAQASLLVVRIPLAFDDRVPLGACAVRRDVAPVTSGGPSVASVRIELPPGAGGGKPPRALRLEVTSPLVPIEKITVEWRDASGEQRTLAIHEEERDATGRRASVPLPLDALESDGRTITLRETVETVQGPAGFADLDVSAEW